MHGPSILCWNRYLNIFYNVYWKDGYLSKFHFRLKIVSGIRHTNKVLFFFHKMFEQTSFIHHCKKVSSQEAFLFCIISIYINKMYYSSYYLIGIHVLEKKSFYLKFSHFVNMQMVIPLIYVGGSINCICQLRK